MHPVLKSSLDPLARLMVSVTLEEAQVPPLPGQGRWSAQEIMEHLILSYELTSTSVSRQLRMGRAPKIRRSILEFMLRAQTIGFGYMPHGVPAIHALRPADFTPESGAAVVGRFLAAAEEMDAWLVAARKKFGIEGCGEHPLFGVLRVDEWRRYHTVHAGHHLKQLRDAIRYARSPELEA